MELYTSLCVEGRRIVELELELESCKQYLNDWTAWSETKTAEYTQLLEAYNQYVEAYNTMSTEYNSLKQGCIQFLIP